MSRTTRKRSSSPVAVDVQAEVPVDPQVEVDINDPRNNSLCIVQVFGPTRADCEMAGQMLEQKLGEQFIYHGSQNTDVADLMYFMSDIQQNKVDDNPLLKYVARCALVVRDTDRKRIRKVQQHRKYKDKM